MPVFSRQYIAEVTESGVTLPIMVGAGDVSKIVKGVSVNCVVGPELRSRRQQPATLTGASLTSGPSGDPTSTNNCADLAAAQARVLELKASIAGLRAQLDTTGTTPNTCGTLQIAIIFSSTALQGFAAQQSIELAESIANGDFEVSYQVADGAITVNADTLVEVDSATAHSPVELGDCDLARAYPDGTPRIPHLSCAVYCPAGAPDSLFSHCAKIGQAGYCTFGPDASDIHGVPHASCSSNLGSGSESGSGSGSDSGSMPLVPISTTNLCRRMRCGGPRACLHAPGSIGAQEDFTCSVGIVDDQQECEQANGVFCEMLTDRCFDPPSTESGLIQGVLAVLSASSLVDCAASCVEDGNACTGFAFGHQTKSAEAVGGCNPSHQAPDGSVRNPHTDCKGWCRIDEVALADGAPLYNFCANTPGQPGVGHCRPVNFAGPPKELSHTSRSVIGS